MEKARKLAAAAIPSLLSCRTLSRPHHRSHEAAVLVCPLFKVDTTMAHPVVKDFRKDCLDICELRRIGLLSGKQCKIQGSSIRWPKIDSMTVDPTCIQIKLTNGHQQTFSISWAQEFPTTKRPWLLCPSCGERRARLFRGFAGYHCRWCLELWYASQAVCARKRQHQRLAKLCTKIDGKPWHYDNTKHITVPKRPAGKHRRRYFKLRGAIADLQAQLGRVVNNSPRSV